MTNKKDYQAILAISLGFFILNLIFNLEILFYLGFSVLFFSFCFSSFVIFATKLWYGLALFLGNINGKIILSTVYLLFVFPLSLAYKIFDNKMLIKKSKKKPDSFFVNRKHRYIKDDFTSMGYRLIDYYSSIKISV